VRIVRSALREHGIGDAPVEGSRLDLKTATEYVDGTRKFVGYQCQAAFAVESGALDDVEPLLVDVVAAGANDIEGVDFDVAAKRELRAEARRKPAAARAKRPRPGLTTTGTVYRSCAPGPDQSRAARWATGPSARCRPKRTHRQREPCRNCQRRKPAAASASLESSDTRTGPGGQAPSRAAWSRSG
jgi:hypothetical protein